MHNPYETTEARQFIFENKRSFKENQGYTCLFNIGGVMRERFDRLDYEFYYAEHEFKPCENLEMAHRMFGRKSRVMILPFSRGGYEMPARWYYENYVVRKKPVAPVRDFDRFFFEYKPLDSETTEWMDKEIYKRKHKQSFMSKKNLQKSKSRCGDGKRDINAFYTGPCSYGKWVVQMHKTTYCDFPYWPYNPMRAGCMEIALDPKKFNHGVGKGVWK